MKKIVSFIGSHFCRIAITIGLVLLAVHWGLMGIFPIFVAYLLWE